MPPFLELMISTAQEVKPGGGPELCVGSDPMMRSLDGDVGDQAQVAAELVQLAETLLRPVAAT